MIGWNLLFQYNQGLVLPRLLECLNTYGPRQLRKNGIPNSSFRCKVSRHKI